MDQQDTNMQLPAVQKGTPNEPVVPSQIQPSVNTGTNSTQASTHDPMSLPDADDVDLIEKAWVDKAKEIVKNTMGNPHAQSEEFNKMKVVYIKKRYNKDIKADF